MRAATSKLLLIFDILHFISKWSKPIEINDRKNYKIKFDVMTYLNLCLILRI